MKIVYISLYPVGNEKHSYASGAAYFTKDLALNVPFDKKDELFILCNKLNGKAETYKEDGFVIIRCFDRNPKFIFQILNEIRKIKPDIIHVQQELALYGNIFTAYILQWMIAIFRFMNFKTIITIHGVLPLSSIDKNFILANNYKLPVWIVKFGLFVIFKPLCIRSNKVIVHGEYFKDILVEEYGVKKEKIEVTNIGIEKAVSIDKATACKRLHLDYKKNIILFIGYLAGYKGLDLLIEGFSQYIKKDKDACLIIAAGKHPKLYDNKDYLAEYNRLSNKAIEMIPAQNFKWVGFVKENDLQIYFGACDVSIYPYTVCMGPSGPMGLSIARNRPFLASDAFSIIVNDEHMLFKQSPGELIDALNYFFSHKDYFIKSLTQMREDRSWVKIGKKTYNIYKSLLS